MTKKNVVCFCDGISDRDFIFDVFSDKGFVANASHFLQSEDAVKNADADKGVLKSDSQLDCEECGINL